MANDLQLNIGALRSAMTLTLHTHHASRIWHGRPLSDDKHAIIGLNAFVSIMAKMKRGAEQDDPYSDWWMLRIEEKLDATKQHLQALRERVDQVLNGVPTAIALGENLSVHPVTLPLFIGTQFGFMAVYRLIEFDNLARRLLLAHHTALIDRQAMTDWITEGAHTLRSLFALAQQYHYSGACREDFIANNAVAHAAREKYGDLPPEIMDGTRRSAFAPPLARTGPPELDTTEVPSPVPESPASGESSPDAVEEGAQ